jgi:hypothetical protein
LTDELEVIVILDKLIYDRFVIREIRAVKTGEGEITKEYVSGPYFAEIAHYQITFEGKVRIEQDGGYYTLHKMASEERNRIERLEIEQRKITKHTFILTVLGSVFALAILVITFLQYLLSIKVAFPKFPCFYC